MYRRENEVHPGSAIETYYQCGVQVTHSNMLLELFCQIISEPCFDILRTEDEVGPWVCRPRLRAGRGARSAGAVAGWSGGSG